MAQAVLHMDTTRQEVNRLIDLKHTTRLDRIEDAMSAIGEELELSVACCTSVCFDEGIVELAPNAHKTMSERSEGGRETSVQVQKRKQTYDPEES
jgi:hypothetical protein